MEFLIHYHVTIALFIAGAGIILFRAGSLMQIAEEWKDRGLTDTSYGSLLLMAGGSTLIAISAAITQHWFIAVLSFVPIEWTMIYLKLKDHLRSRRRK